jgi:hypothetical protein
MPEFKFKAAWFSSVVFVALPVLAMAAEPDALSHERGGERWQVFISPAGEPFRAPPDQPYPVANWFQLADRNHNGRVDRQEFVLDFERYFAVLDRSHAGWLNGDADRGVGLSLFTLQITHHIGPNVDNERDMVGALLNASGGRAEGEMSSRITSGQWHRNGGGDKYRTDGAISIVDLGSICKTG